MKKKLLIVSLVVALVLTCVAPSPVMAASGKWAKSSHGYHWPQPEDFSAAAHLTVVDPGQSVQYGPYIFTRGEKVQGYFTYTDWDALTNAVIEVTHASIIKLNPDSPVHGTYFGYARASIKIALQSGSILTGTYQATIQGEYSIIDLGAGPQLVINYVNDDGTFNIRGRDGQTYTIGQGDWAALLILTDLGGGIYTLVGDAGISGTHTDYTLRW